MTVDSDIGTIVASALAVVAMATAYVREIHRRLSACEAKHDECDRRIAEMERRLVRRGSR